MTTRNSTRASTGQMVVDSEKDAEPVDRKSTSPTPYTLPAPAPAPESNQTPSLARPQDFLSPETSSSKPCGLSGAPRGRIEPPITKGTLSQLDPNRLLNGLLLRHDINFDPYLHYRPTTNGEQGDLRRSISSEYWHAIKIEIMEFFMNNDTSRPCPAQNHGCPPKSMGSRKRKRHERSKLMRLPLMFETVRDIMKGLLPEEDWLAIDRRLDTNLLLQELENDSCDFTDLSDWIGGLLRRYCFLERKQSIDHMTSAIRHGIHDMVIDDILSGLMQIFDILETMKLDRANRDIRSLRFAMMDSTVEFEQEDFLNRIAQGWDVSQAHTWFSREQQERRRSSGLDTLAASITDLLITNSDNLPPTLTLDYLRIRSLQSQIQNFTYQSACRWAFEELVETLGKIPTPRTSLNDLFSRIHAITTPTTTTTDDISPQQPKPQQTDHVVLEIVRQAYHLLSIHKLPTPTDVESTESNLVHAADPSTSVYRGLQRYFTEDLHSLVEEEVRAIKDLSLVQISTRYVSDGTMALAAKGPTEQTELVRFAQQIAHISVLHWRVWGPILYELPEGGRRG